MSEFCSLAYLAGSESWSESILKISQKEVIIKTWIPSKGLICLQETTFCCLKDLYLEVPGAASWCWLLCWLCIGTGGKQKQRKGRKATSKSASNCLWTEHGVRGKLINKLQKGRIASLKVHSGEDTSISCRLQVTVCNNSSWKPMAGKQLMLKPQAAPESG